MLIKLLILNLMILNAFCIKKPIGVSIERASLYDSSKPFACIDGSGVIPFEMVNDDYCDCRDGSDEPGTSACLNGVFTCDNLGHVASYIPASRVNDGICDCCDGSDEYNGKLKCENICNAEAIRMKEEQEKAKVMFEAGINKKRELIEKGNELKKTMRDRVSELQNKLSNAENEKILKEEAKNTAEGKSKEATDIEDKVIEEEKKRQELIDRENRSNELFSLLDENQDGILSASELLSHNELDILFDNDGRFTIEEAEKLIDQKTDLNAKQFFEQYYDQVSSHLKFIEQEAQVETTPQAEETTHHEEEEEQVEEQDYEGVEETSTDLPPSPGEHHKRRIQSTTQASQESKDKYSRETQALLDISENFRQEFDKAVRELNEIKDDIEKLNKKLSLDNGPNEEYASLIDQCFEFDDREYTYILCPYDRTVQKSKSNNGETSIGTWSSWDTKNPASKYTAMLYTNGVNCWNGPARSCKVHLSCGVENKITSVAEPNRCEYEMKFETPTACDESFLTNLHKERSEHTEL